MPASKNETGLGIFFFFPTIIVRLWRVQTSDIEWSEKVGGIHQFMSFRIHFIREMLNVSSN